ncbi:OmpA family protein [Pseudomonas sp. NPDC089392]|uniref:OmpA family protein n=1 Tax=Pseudomonas sp. NPDC089392 TaxID=3364459 RepID=UPI003811FACC
MSVTSKAALPLLVAASLLAGCATHSDGSAPLNQRTWPICSVLGGLVGGGLGAIESSTWAAAGGALGAVAGGLICFAQDGDEDGDGIFDRRDRCPDTPANTPVDHMGCPLKQYPAAPPVPEAERAPEVIILDDNGAVMFAFDSAELTPAAQQRLQGLVEKLNAPTVAKVRVVGHTDNVGSDSYNQALSERRASSVAEFLISQGLEPGKVTSQGRGESEPVTDNESEEGRTRNRRVELHLD